MPNNLHHVVMRSHSAESFIRFLTDVAGMEVQAQLHVPGAVFESTLGWPPSDGADITILGSGMTGLVEVIDVPEHLRDVAPEGLAALSFMTDDFARTQEAAKSHASDVTVFDAGFSGVDLFFCTMGGVPVEFMGAYAVEAASEG